MKTKIIYGISSMFTLLILLAGCSKEEYSLGDLKAPSNVVVHTEIVGQSDDNPYGDGSGLVHITVEADNAIAYKIDFGASSSINLVPFNGKITRQFTRTGANDYRLTVVVYGAGGSTTTVIKEITVESVFNADPALVANLIGNGSKTWIVDKSVPGHFGVGPWDNASTGPEWWSAGVNEKVGSADCFYSSKFTFSKTGSEYTLTVEAPDGAFTKTGALSNNLPGIPGEGAEGCYGGYPGGSSTFSFVPSSTGIPASTPSTKTSIEIAGNDTFIGYGAVQKEYEILVITENYLYLRVRGTETGNAWYIKLVPVQ